MSTSNVSRTRQQQLPRVKIGRVSANLVCASILAAVAGYASAQTVWGSNSQVYPGGSHSAQPGATVYIGKDGLNTSKSLNGPVPIIKNNYNTNTKPMEYNHTHIPIGNKKQYDRNRELANDRAFDALESSQAPGSTVQSTGTAAYGGHSATATGTSTLSEDGRWLFKGGVLNSPGNEPAVRGSFRYDFSD